MKQKIVCMIAARVNSKRVKNKMIRPFAGKTLLDYALEKIKMCKFINNDNFYLAACEDPILEIGLRNNVKIYDRAPETLHEKVPVEVARKFVWEIDAEYFIEVTACTPFLKPSTIDAAVDYMFNSNIKSLFSIVPRKNFFFDNNSTLINDFEGEEHLIHTLDTKLISTVYEAGHAIYIWSADEFKNNKKRWSFKNGDPYLYEIHPMESFDIDYQWQFDIAEVLMNNNIHKSY